jgi:hypothetical protein
MTVTGVVMADGRRAAWAEELADHLGLPITWDKVSDRHETGLRCLQAGLDASQDVSHWLVVQDDALVARDLLAGLTEAVKVSGDRIVGLYAGHTNQQIRRQMRAAQTTGVSWVPRSKATTLWGVGLVIPTVHLTELIAHYQKSREQNYDRRIERWADAAKVECWFTAPSLVDHRVGPENPSLVPNRTSLDRRACWFHGGSALDIDWSKVSPPPTGLWRKVGTQQITKARPGTPQALRLEQSGRYEPVVEARCGECGSRQYKPAQEVTV